jgi:uncharacterized protein
MEGRCQYVTLVVTENCNLRCKYCYESGKNSNNVMTPEVAFKAIDFIFDKLAPRDGLVLEFTGGEPCLELELLEQTIAYFKERLWSRPDHPWFSSYILMFGTNGVLYDSERFQRLLWQNRDHCYPAVTIDGTKRKHDAARIFPDGLGSYDIVAKNVKLLLKQWPDALTKLTFSSPDLPYLCESVLHVWDLGFKDIGANVVYEDVWKPGDPELFESELRKLADISIEKGYWETHKCSLFWKPRPKDTAIVESEDDRNFCGSGTMLSIDSKGNLYPCLRFHQFSMSKKKARDLGNVFNGYKQDMVRPFHCLCKSLQSSEECLSCEYKENCGWCTGLNYDMSDTSTIFQRVTYICEMHKARWRANQYYWEQLKKIKGIIPEMGELQQCTGCSI